MSYIQSNAVVPLAQGNNTISASDSGKIFTVTQAAVGVNTLPVPASGLKYTFILREVAANAVQIAAAAAATNILGHSIVGPQAGATIRPGAGTNTVRFSTTCIVGDQIDLTSDGTNWYCRATSGSNTAATGIIFT